MIRFFKSADRSHSRTSFKLIILLSEKHLVYRHLEYFAPGDFRTEERQVTDRYVIAGFLRRGEYDARQWREITGKEYRLCHRYWHRLQPKRLNIKDLKL